MARTSATLLSLFILIPVIVSGQQPRVTETSLNDWKVHGSEANSIVLKTYDLSESYLAGWDIVDENGFVTQTSEESFSGAFGAKLSSAPGKDYIDFALTSPADFAAGQSISYRVYIPSDTSNLDYVAPYIVFDDINDDNNDSDGYADVKYHPDSLTLNTWNELTIEVPIHISIQSIGLRIQAKTTSTLPDFYVDFITSDPEAESFASIAAISTSSSAFRIDSVSTNYIAFNWDMPEGRGLNNFLIQRRRYAQDAKYALIDSTKELYYIDENVFSNTVYSYQVIPVDTLGRIPEYNFGHFNQLTNAFPTDTTFDFENSFEGWQSDDLTIDETRAYSAFTSLRYNAPGITLTEGFSKSDGLDFIDEDQRLFFHIRFAQTDLEMINSLVLYYKKGSSNTKISNSISAEDLSPETWERISLQVETDSLNEVGIEINKKESSSTPAFNIDLITTDPNNNGVPTLTTPSQLTLTSLSYLDASIKWNNSAGAGEKKYSGYLWQYPFGEQFYFDSVTDTALSYTDLRPGYPYRFSVRAVDETGKRTDTTLIDFITPDFESDVTFDFEKTTEDWEAQAGTVNRSTERSYSGIYSLEFEPAETESHLRLQNQGDILPGHKLTFRLWISEDDTSGIDHFRPYVQDGTSDWQVTSAIYQIDDIEVNSWNELSYTIPLDISDLQAVGLHVSATPTGSTFFVDLISTEYEPLIRPHLSIPGNLRTNVENSLVTLEWDASSGSDPISTYNIYKGDENAVTEQDFVLSASRTATSYSEFISQQNTTLRFAVTAVNDQGLETFLSDFEEVVISATNVDPESAVPRVFALYDNYPNPFNPSTQIQYDIPITSEVRIGIYDISGRLVQTLVDKVHSPGTYTQTFSGDQFASGVYFYKIQTNGFTEIKRMLLIK